VRGDHEGYCVRWMIRRDLPQVMEIERASFEHAWTEDDFLNALRQRNAIGMVYESAGQIQAFVVYELLGTRIHILNIAVGPQFRRAGVGSRVVERLTRKLEQQRRKEIVLELRETNLGAQMFFASIGFRATQILHGHYSDTGDTAYRMVYRVGQEQLAGRLRGQP
jgi:[ribosomal protein S18]-alanine N-acetyltransferase